MTTRDFYQVLGVARTATAEEIQRAYRTLARRYHPDINKEPGAEDRFKAVSAAYSLLGDEDKRGKYDRGEIDETGAETPPRHYYRDYAQSGDAGARYESAHGFSDFAEADDIFSSFFSRRAGGLHCRLQTRWRFCRPMTLWRRRCPPLDVAYHHDGTPDFAEIIL